MLAAMLLLMISSSAALMAQDKNVIKKSMKGRYPALIKLKTDNKIGETTDGFVEALNEEFAKVDSISSVVSGENEDRKALYALIAKDTETTPDVVGKNNALRIFNKAEDTEYFKGKDNKWRQKKDMK